MTLAIGVEDLLGRRTSPLEAYLVAELLWLHPFAASLGEAETSTWSRSPTRPDMRQASEAILRRWS